MLPLPSAVVRVVAAALACVTSLAWTTVARAAPEVHVLGVDTRDGLAAGRPIVTTLVTVEQTRPVSEIVRSCARPADRLACWEERLATPGAFGAPFPFPRDHARFVVRVGDEDRALELVDATRWLDAPSTARAGTAWIVALDASASMGARYEDARASVYMLVQAMRPQDLVDLVVFDDRGILRDTKWKTFTERNAIVTALSMDAHVAPPHTGERRLPAMLQMIAEGGMASLYARDDPNGPPLHRAMVVLSSGSGRADAVAAEIARAAFDNGRFTDRGVALPKTPLPVVAIWFPAKSTIDPSTDRGAQTMLGIASIASGGSFVIARPDAGRAPVPAATFTNVRARFDRMWIVRWRMPCANPTVEQSFTLAIEGTAPAIVPDATFKDVLIGVAPTDWPIDVDADATAVRIAAPGDVVTVRGRFCWASDPKRVEAFFFAPGGTKSMSEIRAEDVRGEVLDVSATAVKVRIPSRTRALVGDGAGVVRLALVDTVARRSSATGAGAIAIPIAAAEKPTVNDAAAPPVTIVSAPIAPPSRGCACDLGARRGEGSGAGVLAAFGALLLARVRRWIRAKSLVPAPERQRQ